MWILWALVAALGSTTWYLAPKFFPSENVFTPLVVSGFVGIFLGLIGSKIFHHTWFEPKAVPLGILLSLSWLATLGLVLAFQQGGKVGPVSVVIELSVLLAAIVSVFYFREHLNIWQMVGIILAVSGIGLVVFFEK